jgi:hypothetical protein
LVSWCLGGLTKAFRSGNGRLAGSRGELGERRWGSKALFFRADDARRYIVFSYDYSNPCASLHRRDG